jgi:hypothetical protein
MSHVEAFKQRRVGGREGRGRGEDKKRRRWRREEGGRSTISTKIILRRYKDCFVCREQRALILPKCLTLKPSLCRTKIK